MQQPFSSPVALVINALRSQLKQLCRSVLEHGRISHLLHLQTRQGRELRQRLSHEASKAAALCSVSVIHALILAAYRKRPKLLLDCLHPGCQRCIFLGLAKEGIIVKVVRRVKVREATLEPEHLQLVRKLACFWGGQTAEGGREAGRERGSEGGREGAGEKRQCIGSVLLDLAVHSMHA